MSKIVKVGVVGAGTMGSGIAALVASAGLPVVLLDVPAASDRNALARGALAKLQKAKPAPLMDSSRASLISVGNTADHLHLLADCDWIVEAIIEQLPPKLELYERLEPIRKPTAIVSSNTSGIPMKMLTTGRSEAFRQHFLGTHFFNPPRYLHLLELINGPDTTPETLGTMRAFAERTLGKGVVIAKDAPGFIANRLGLYAVARALRLMELFDLSIDDVDFLTGPLIGRAKSATFRTGDITGIDVLAHVAQGTALATGEDFTLPEWVTRLVASGRHGDKTGSGFYKKVGPQITTLDWKTLEYRPQSKPSFPELEPLLSLPLDQRLASLTTASGTGADFVRALLLDISHYTIAKASELAFDIASIDRAMEWGYAYEMGPFRQMDAMGLPFIRQQFAAQSRTKLPLLEAAQESFYRHLASGPRQLTFANGYVPIEPIPGHIDLGFVRATTGSLHDNESAALVDIGDGVLLLEFRAKMNTLGPGVFTAFDEAAAQIDRGRFHGLVISNADPRTFSAGANLAGVAAEVHAGNWKGLEAAVHAFQQGVMSVRRSPFPVVIAPFGLTLGGGAELTLHTDMVQAHAELYMGLVEVGVGLIPGGGGTKELLFRFTRELAAYDDVDPFEGVKRAFKLISMATTSTSALEAAQCGFLRDRDRVSMNRDRLISDAKARVIDLAPNYVPPAPQTIRVLGNEALGNLEYGVWSMAEGGYITAHDQRIGRALARVLAGGDGPPRTVSEQDILDLEREAFLSLLGTKETQERIVHTLNTGKPLRN